MPTQSGVENGLLHNTFINKGDFSIKKNLCKFKRPLIKNRMMKFKAKVLISQTIWRLKSDKFLDTK